MGFKPATIADREGRVKGAIFEVQSIIEEFKMQAIGGMMAAWELWERALLPSLLSGAGTWVGCTAKEEERCDKLQYLFWRVMFRVPESCPRIALRAETRMIDMKHRIWQMKLLLLKRIKKQGTETLCGRILEEQQTRGWPGLSKEVSEICEKLSIPDINIHDGTDGYIKKSVVNHDYMELKEELGKSKKMESHKDEDFENVQPYMHGKDISKTRMCFRVRCEMVDDIKGNFKSKYTRNGDENALICEYDGCNQVETQGHCMVCPQWESIRQGLDLTNIDDLASFFQKLLLARAKLKAGSKKELHSKTPVPVESA
jgi:hypothetical protein